MSHSFYNKQWMETQMMLGDIITREKPMLGEDAAPITDKKEVFHTLAMMYISYVQALRQLDQCYDQMVHPQKRRLLRHILDGTMGRILELKNELVQLECTDFHFFEDILTCLKLTPHDMEMPIPKYFLVEKEKVLRERYRLLEYILARLNKKEETEPSITSEHSLIDAKSVQAITTLEDAVKLIQIHERARRGRMRAKFMVEMTKRKERDLENARSRSVLIGMDVATAAVIIQKMWRGMLQRERTKKLREEEMIFLGMALPPPADPAATPRAVAIQNEAERRKIQESNENEYQMALVQIKDKVREQEGPDMKDTLMEQIRQWFLECRNALGKFPDYPSEEEGGSLKIMKEKDPIEAYKELEQTDADKGKKKEKGKEKKKKDDKKSSKSKKKKSQKSDEDDDDDDDDDSAAVKFKSRIKKNNAEDESEDEGWKMGNSNFLGTLEESSINYNDLWANKDEKANSSQRYDADVIRTDKRMEIEKEIRLQVDELMRQELKNLKLAIDKDKGRKGRASKSGKKRGKGKKGKKEKKMKDLTPDSTFFANSSQFGAKTGALKQAPAKSADYSAVTHSNLDDLETWMNRKSSGKASDEKQTSDESPAYHITHTLPHSSVKGKKRDKEITGNRTIESLYEELVCEGIIKPPEKVLLKDFVGEYSYIGSLMKLSNSSTNTNNSNTNNSSTNNSNEPKSPLADIRRIVSEYAILPLGSPAVHEKAPMTKSILLAGPKGTGKKMLVHAICNETGANLIDLSASNIVGKYPGKDGLKLLLHMVFKVGKAFQPSVIYIGDCEKMFKKKIPKTDLSDPKRLKKELPKALKFIKGEDRIILIGTSNSPFDGEVKPMCSTYQKVILIPRPDYQSRRLIWRELITRNGAGKMEGPTPPLGNLDLSSLSKISDGYTPGAMDAVCKALLTDVRVRQLPRKPLTAGEFVSQLATVDPVYKEEEEAFKVWFTKTPLGKKRAKLLAGDTEEGKDKKSAKKNEKAKK